MVLSLVLILMPSPSVDRKTHCGANFRPQLMCTSQTGTLYHPGVNRTSRSWSRVLWSKFKHTESSTRHIYFLDSTCFLLLLYLCLLLYCEALFVGLMGNWLQPSEFTTDEWIKLSVTVFVHLPREPHAAAPPVPRHQRAIFSREEERGGVLPGKITPAAHT